MNGAAATAATAAPPPNGAAPAASAPASTDAGNVPDFLALLGGVPSGAATAAAANAEPATDADADATKLADDDGDPPAAGDSGAAPTDLLLALRQSLALIAQDPAHGDVQAKPDRNPSAPAAPTAKPASGDVAGAALAALSGAMTDDADGTADPALPTADRQFDAMLATMTGNDAASGVSAPVADPMLTSATGLGGAPAASATSLAAPPMTVPPDHPQFIGDLGERIVWIADASAGTGLTSAKIELHPLDLGSVSVHVQMRGDTAQVSFAADNPATRALLQDSLPQLRELMSVQGLQLLRAQVEQRVGATRASDTAFSQSRERGDGRDGIAVVRRVTRLKLLDAYA